MSRIKQYLPKKAYECLQDNSAAVLIDVRCEA
ncbi:MAG: rhodanese-like domain-containing protein, partial [Candidatus Thioglobus sp.]